LRYLAVPHSGHQICSAEGALIDRADNAALSGDEAGFSCHLYLATYLRRLIAGVNFLAIQYAYALTIAAQTAATGNVLGNKGGRRGFRLVSRVATQRA